MKRKLKQTIICMIFAMLGICNCYAAHTYTYEINKPMTVNDTKKCIDNAMQFLDNIPGYAGKFSTVNAKELLLGTAIQESSLRARYQDGVTHTTELATGLFQMEKATFDDILYRYLPQNKPTIRNAIIKKFGKIKHADLLADPELAAVFARLKYWMIPEALPKAGDINAQARYWGKYYNTRNEQQKIEQYTKNYWSFIK